MFNYKTVQNRPYSTHAHRLITRAVWLASAFLPPLTAVDSSKRRQLATAHAPAHSILRCTMRKCLSLKEEQNTSVHPKKNTSVWPTSAHTDRHEAARLLLYYSYTVLQFQRTVLHLQHCTAVGLLYCSVRCQLVLHAAPITHRNACTPTTLGDAFVALPPH